MGVFLSLKLRDKAIRFSKQLSKRNTYLINGHQSRHCVFFTIHCMLLRYYPCFSWDVANHQTIVFDLSIFVNHIQRIKSWIKAIQYSNSCGTIHTWCHTNWCKFESFSCKFARYHSFSLITAMLNFIRCATILYII